MKVLRNNKDSVMAMLEAFVHDPLINWRLLNTTDTVPETATSRDADSNKGLGRPFILPRSIQLKSQGCHGIV